MPPTLLVIQDPNNIFSRYHKGEAHSATSGESGTWRTRGRLSANPHLQELEDAVRAFDKQSFDAAKMIKVRFIGESAEDEGGPRQETRVLLVTHESCFPVSGNVRWLAITHHSGS